MAQVKPNCNPCNVYSNNNMKMFNQSPFKLGLSEIEMFVTAYLFGLFPSFVDVVMFNGRNSR